MNNKIKTMFFGALIAAMILPFSSMGVAEAQQTPTKYTLEQINSAFTIAQEHVTYEEETNHMILDIAEMQEHGATSLDVTISLNYASIHNSTMDAYFSGNVTQMEMVDNSFRTGLFSNIFNQDQPVKKSHQRTEVFNLSACGITFDQTKHPVPGISIDEDNHSSYKKITEALADRGYHEVYRYAVDPDDVGFVYAKVNTTGYGGCIGGEFRDENHIYRPSMTHYYDEARENPTRNWHTLLQENEPNPEIRSYSPPTIWWNAYVAAWHFDLF